MNDQGAILIIGLGLIGGSIARSLRAVSTERVILACDTDSEAIALARQDGIIDESGELEALLPQADLIIIALPPIASAAILPVVAKYKAPQAIVTDVASVKSHIIAAANALSPEFNARFVPGHPIAGSEQSGYAASLAGLFRKRNIILIPQAVTDPDAVAAVHRLWRSMGANLLGMSLRRHDEVLAATSHLPHLLAYSIVDVLLNQEQSEEIFRYAAGGFADFSRLASSDPQMWSDIFTANAEPVERVLDAFIADLKLFKKALLARDHAFIMQKLTRTQQARNNFMEKYFMPEQASTSEPEAVTFIAEPGGTVEGSIRVPGDKSISHRSIILGAIANGVSHVSGFLEGEDALQTVAAFREMGVTIVGPENGELTIYGVGKQGLLAPREPLYMGNSGTAMRLLAGLLAAQDFSSELTGDESLSRRPMGRVAEPLTAMGAHIHTSEGGTPPIRIEGSPLKGISYNLPVASAQIKSCLLLAGLYADGITEITEPGICRDHTERMLAGFHYPIEQDPEHGVCRLEGGHELQATDIDIPADISSAAFFMVAAAITPQACLVLEHVGINPTRLGIVNLLQMMGARITLDDQASAGGEPVATITVQHSELTGIEIPMDQIPLAIDEFPALFIAAACARGETVLRGAEELRVKESDRLSAMAEGLTTLGIELETYPDGIRIQGGQLGGGEVDSKGDHRIAMAFAIASLRASGTITIRNCANVGTSFPGFLELARSAGLKVSSQGG